MDIPLVETNISKPLTNTIYIANMSEDVWPFIAAMSDKKKQDFEIAENADLSDRDLFSFCGEDNLIFILPRPVDQTFLDYYTSLFGKKNFLIIVPKKHSGNICEDILNESGIIDTITKAANGSKRLTITSYTTSQSFLKLIRTLRSQGLVVFTPDSPEEEDSWTVNFYGSKSGIRQLAQQGRAAEPDLVMPDGIVVSGIIDASRIAANKYIREHGVVIKTNKGHSGAGVLILRSGELPYEYDSCQNEILKMLKKDTYWDIFPIVIESLITVSQTIGGGYPSVEYQILKNGHVELLYYCGMRVTKDGEFRGMEINNEVISDQIAARLIDTGFYVGEQYRANGYHGFFDIDFVAAKNGQLYVTESNVRRTGGTHVYAIAEKLFGKDFMYLTHIVSNNIYDLPTGKTYIFSDLLSILDPILFNKKTREGLVLVSENLLSYNRIGYVIFANTQKRVDELELRLELLLRA
jgi:hypothetical protein